MKIKIQELEGIFVRVMTEDDDVNMFHNDILDFDVYGVGISRMLNVEMSRCWNVSAR